MMKFALKAVTFGVLTAGSTMVMAEDAPSFYGITATGSVAATTDYASAVLRSLQIIQLFKVASLSLISQVLMLRFGGQA